MVELVCVSVVEIDDSFVYVIEGSVVFNCLNFVVEGMLYIVVNIVEEGKQIGEVVDYI